MSIQFKEVNFSNVVDKLCECCLSEEVCGECNSSTCLISYGKECLKYCMINKTTGVVDGYKNIPLLDTKLYDKEFAVDGIVDILKTCKSCREDHFENCIINIIRNCYEIILTGQEQEYNGSALLYINSLKEIDSDLSDKVFEKFNLK